MNSLFNDTDRNSLLGRLAALEPGAARLWGKMNSAQMLAHLCVAMADAAGERVWKQRLLGKIVTPLIRSSVFGAKPFGRGAPTDSSYKIAEAREFETERVRLTALIERFAREGAGAANGRVHPFFGKLTSDEWGVLTYKHIDHHLRQFGG